MKVGGSGESRDQEMRLRTGTGVPELEIIPIADVVVLIIYHNSVL